MEQKIKDYFTKENLKKFFKSLIKSPIFYITLAAIIIDIVSKWCIVLNIPLDQNGAPFVYIIPNFLYVTLTFNKGAIGGTGANSWGFHVALIVIRTILAVAIPVVYLLKGKELKKRYKVCIMLIYAGCIGNLIDGLFYYPNICGLPGGVVDWIGITGFFGIFNLADSYVTVCVILIILFLIIDEIKELVHKNRRGEFSMTPEEYQKKLDAEKKKDEDHHQEK